MTRNEFIGLYPEFTSAPEPFVTVVIAECELLVSDTFGTQRLLVLALTVAARLADSPQGRAARLESGQEPSWYAVRLKNLQRANAVSGLRIG